MTNKEKFLQLVSENDAKTIVEVKQRIKNRAMLRESQRIALKILLRLDELNMSQADLARRMEVKPQQITKIVSGKENLTIETQIKIQSILDVPILASYYEDRMKQSKEIKVTVSGEVINYNYTPELPDLKMPESKSVNTYLTVEYNSFNDNSAA